MTNLPESFRHIRLELARETGHPEGDNAHGYDIIAPLTADGYIDAEIFKDHKDSCRVRRFRPGEADTIGKLVHGPGGRWLFDYDEGIDSDNEAGYRFGQEQFRIGDYVSIREDNGEMHTFKVMRIEEL